MEMWSGRTGLGVDLIVRERGTLLAEFSSGKAIDCEGGEILGFAFASRLKLDAAGVQLELIPTEDPGREFGFEADRDGPDSLLFFWYSV